jgi:hypothetical protein
MLLFVALVLRGAFLGDDHIASHTEKAMRGRVLAWDVRLKLQ